MVVVILLHIKIHTAVAHVCISVVQNLPHQLLLLDDVSGGMRFDAGRKASQGVHSLVEAVGEVLCHLHGFQLLEPCLLGYLVFSLVCIVLQVAYVGDVTHVAHLVSYMTQVAEEQVEGDGRTCMAQMSIAVNGGTAHIHAHMTGVDGTEELLLSRECIVDNEWLFHNVSDVLFVWQSYGIIVSRQRRRDIIPPKATGFVGPSSSRCRRRSRKAPHEPCHAGLFIYVL